MYYYQLGFNTIEQHFFLTGGLFGKTKCDALQSAKSGQLVHTFKKIQYESYRIFD